MVADGVLLTPLNGLIPSGGVPGRFRGDCSARRRNCSGVNGDPGEPVECNERGLVPPGVLTNIAGEMVEVRFLGSGVLGGRVEAEGLGDPVTSSAPSFKVAELIHFCSFEPIKGASGIC